MLASRARGRIQSHHTATFGHAAAADELDSPHDRAAAPARFPITNLRRSMRFASLDCPLSLESVLNPIGRTRATSGDSFFANNYSPSKFSGGE